MPGLPSGASADESNAAIDVAVIDGNKSAAPFSKSKDFELVNFISEVAMERSSRSPTSSRNKIRGKRSSSRESVPRAKRFHSSDEENDDVVGNLNFGEYYCTDECAPYN